MSLGTLAPFCPLILVLVFRGRKLLSCFWVGGTVASRTASFLARMVAAGVCGSESFVMVAAPPRGVLVYDDYGLGLLVMSWFLS